LSQFCNIAFARVKDYSAMSMSRFLSSIE